MNDLNTVVDFINSIGIEAKFVDGANGFLDHVVIKNGTIEISPKASVGDVLHEAGHLAIIPKKFRHLADGDIDDSVENIFSLIQDLDGDHPDMIAMLQCSDTEATAWAWAAGKNLNIEEDKIIENHSYEGTGESIRLALRMRSYLGINGMAAAGMVKQREYPSMIKWTQDADGPKLKM